MGYQEQKNLLLRIGLSISKDSPKTPVNEDEKDKSLLERQSQVETGILDLVTLVNQKALGKSAKITGWENCQKERIVLPWLNNKIDTLTPHKILRTSGKILRIENFPGFFIPDRKIYPELEKPEFEFYIEEGRAVIEEGKSDIPGLITEKDRSILRIGPKILEAHSQEIGYTYQIHKTLDPHEGGINLTLVKPEVALAITSKRFLDFLTDSLDHYPIRD